MKKNPQLPQRSEAKEQAAVIAWCRMPQPGFLSIARHIYAILNGARVPTKSYASRLKKEGLLPGMPDLCLPVARMGRNSLYIEMKRRDGPLKLKGSQLDRARDLLRLGHLVALCRGSDAAIMCINQYLLPSSLIMGMKTFTRRFEDGGYLVYS